MFIAKQKKQNNIAEYILYMWQIEDIIRANQFDIDKINQTVISRFELTDAQKTEMRNWYAGLIDLMKEESIKEKGHLQFLKNTVNDLNELHKKLLTKPEELEYQKRYRNALPNIMVFQKKEKKTADNEIETCFNGLYAKLLLKLQTRDLTKETEQAIETFRQLIVMLAKKYHDDEG